MDKSRDGLRTARLRFLNADRRGPASLGAGPGSSDLVGTSRAPPRVNPPEPEPASKTQNGCANSAPRTPQHSISEPRALSISC